MLPSYGKIPDGKWTDEHAGECARFVAEGLRGCALCRSTVGGRRELKAVVADLEAKVAALEREKEALQRRLDKSFEEKATLTTELLAATDRAVKAEDAAKAAKLLEDDAEKRRALMHKRFHSLKESVRAGATMLQKELPDILKKYGLDAPDVSSVDTVGWTTSSSGSEHVLLCCTLGLISTRI